MDRKGGGIMTIEEMQKRKQELGYSYEQIAELANLPLGTVQKVLGGITKTPRYATRLALEKVLSPKGVYDAELPKMPILMREKSNYYAGKKDGEYTLEDYYALPDERRVELIDGVFYDMASPTHIHQAISGEIYTRFKDHVRKNKGLCVPMYAPLDVQLDCDDKTMIQPDVLVLCDRSKFQHGVVYGAPDLVVEVLSKSTKRKDATLKMTKYLAAGVREYWIVDPKQKKIIVYDFDHEDYPVIYGFESKVPVQIFNGECEVDFAEIYEYISFLYEDEVEL